MALDLTMSELEMVSDALFQGRVRLSGGLSLRCDDQLSLV